MNTSRNPHTHPALAGLAVLFAAVIAALIFLLVARYQELGPAISVGLFIAVLVLGRLLSAYVQWLRGGTRRGGARPDDSDENYASKTRTGSDPSDNDRP